MKFLYIVLSFSLFTLAYGKDFNIKVIHDSNIESSEALNIYQKEIQHDFNNTEYNPKFNVISVSSLEEYKKEINSIKDREKIDAILLLDHSISEMSLKIDSYSLPTIASMGLTQLKDTPHNLNYIYTKNIISNDFKLMKDLFKGSNIYITASKKSTIDNINRINKDFNFNITILDPASKSLDKHKRIDGLYILEGDNDTLQKLTTNKNIPVISRVNDLKNTNKDSLIYFDSLVEVNRRARVSGINLLELAKGGAIKDLTSSVDALDNPPIFNLSIAKRLNIYPDIKYLKEISLIEGKNIKTKPLDFYSGVKLSLHDNLNIKSSMKDIESSKYDITTAKSERRPGASTYTEYSKQDSKSASVPWTSPENTLRGGVSLMYTIFDDEINTKVSVSQLTNKSKKYEYQKNRLDTINDFGNTYLQILKLQEDINIEEANYKLLKKYLQIAKISYKTGSSNKEDIYRFQSEVASSLSKIFQLKGSLKTKQSKLNLILNKPQDNVFYSLKAVEDTDIPFKTMSFAIKKVGLNLSKEDLLRNYLSDISIKNSLEIKTADTSIAAKSKELATAKRLRYTPKVSASGDISKDLVDSWGTGAIDDNSDHWEVGLKVEIPLFEGGAIESQKNSLISQLDSLKYQKDELIASTVQDTLSNLNDVEKYFYQIHTLEENLNASRQNLDLVEQQYVQGTISISDLLDAKTTFIQARSSSNANKYKYLGSILDLERSTGRDFFLMSPEKENDEILKLTRILENSGGVL